MSEGLGALATDPSRGVGSLGEEMGRVYCAEPKMYGTKEWSSRPQTPWEPAGSRV